MVVTTVIALRALPEGRLASTARNSITYSCLPTNSKYYIGDEDFLKLYTRVDTVNQASMATSVSIVPFLPDPDPSVTADRWRR